MKGAFICLKTDSILSMMHESEGKQGSKTGSCL